MTFWATDHFEISQRYNKTCLLTQQAKWGAHDLVYYELQNVYADWSMTKENKF